MIATPCFGTHCDGSLCLVLVLYIAKGVQAGTLSLASPAQSAVAEPPLFPPCTSMYGTLAGTPCLAEPTWAFVSGYLPLPAHICRCIACLLLLNVVARPHRAWLLKVLSCSAHIERCFSYSRSSPRPALAIYGMLAGNSFLPRLQGRCL